MIQYEYLKREHNISYLMRHVETLLGEAIEHKATSFVLYAALEGRTILEMIELDLILMSTPQEEWEQIINSAKGRDGIHKNNRKYKVLKYRFQTFTEALCRVYELPVKAFDYKRSGGLQDELSEYLHTYAASPEEMMYEHPFIQNGIKRVKETLDFVNSFFVKTETGLSFGMLKFSTLSGSTQQAFEEWKATVDEDTEKLYLRLKEINDNENGGAKPVLVDNPKP